MSVLLEFSDHVVIIEGPQNDERTEATIAAVKQLLPSKPIRYVVNTHQHFDHSGGIRAYVAAGIPIVTHEKNKSYWERILGNPFTLEPDRLARASRSPTIETVGEKRVLSDSSMALELHHLQGNLHDETLLVAYLPKQKLLVQADAFHPTARRQASRRAAAVHHQSGREHSPAEAGRRASRASARRDRFDGNGHRSGGSLDPPSPTVTAR